MFYQGEPEADTVIMFHDNAVDCCATNPIASQLNNVGLNTMLIEYCGYGAYTEPIDYPCSQRIIIDIQRLSTRLSTKRILQSDALGIRIYYMLGDNHLLLAIC